MTPPVRTRCCSWITFSVSHKREVKCPLFSDGCRLRWDISRHWRLRWVLFKSELLQRARVLLRRFKRFTFRRMTQRILLRRLHLVSSTRSSTWNDRFRKKVFTLRSTRWPHRAEFLIRSTLVSIITMLLAESKRLFSDTVNCRTLSRSWVSTN